MTSSNRFCKVFRCFFFLSATVASDYETVVIVETYMIFVDYFLWFMLYMHVYQLAVVKSNVLLSLAKKNNMLFVFSTGLLLTS